MNEMSNKPYDWVVALTESPQSTFGDFSQQGLTPDNTALQSRDAYKSSEFIKQRFVDDKGKFDDSKFNNFYDTAVKLYNEYEKDRFNKLDTNENYFFDDNMLRPVGSKTYKKTFDIVKVSNPFKTSYNMVSENMRSEPTKSVRELALESVAQSLDGKSLGFKPMDDSHSGLLDSIFKTPTLVLAQYDADEEHYDKELGEVVKHKKGEYKLNDNGEFFYEQLSGRDPAGKQILSVWDTLSDTGSFANKFDFMDSNGLNKSYVGSVMKTIATVAPAFIPFGIGQVYSGMLAFNQLTDVLPALGGALSGAIVGDEQKDSEYQRNINRLRGFSKTLKQSVSDTSMQSPWTLENFTNLAADVALQLGQQQLMAKLPNKFFMKKAEINAISEANKLLGVEKTRELLSGLDTVEDKVNLLRRIPGLQEAIEKNIAMGSKAGSVAANMYMSLTSAVGVVDEAKAAGLDTRDTSLMFLGLVAGYSQIMRTSIGDWALKGIGMDEITVAANKEAKKQVGTMVKAALKSTTTAEGANATKRASTFFNMGKSIGESISNKINSVATGLQEGKMWAAALAEGTEEVSEEVMSDAMKVIYNGLNYGNMTSTGSDKTDGFGFTAADIRDRYLMNFVGGALGGTLHQVKDSIASHYNQIKEEDKDTIWFARNNFTDKLLEAVKKQESKGIASRNLSLAIDEKNSDIAKGDIVYKPVEGDNYDSSQNAIIANLASSKIKMIDSIIRQENIPSNEWLEKIYGVRAAGMDLRTTSMLEQDIDRITNSLLTVITKQQELTGKINDDSLNEVERKGLQKEYALLETQANEDRKSLQEITSGEALSKYIKQGLFNINTFVNKAFDIKDIEEYAYDKYGTAYSFINNPSLKKKIDTEYSNYEKGEKFDKLREGKEVFDKMMEKASSRSEELNFYADQKFDYYDKIENIELEIKKIRSLDPEKLSKDDLKTNFPHDAMWDSTFNVVKQHLLSSQKVNKIFAENLLYYAATKEDISHLLDFNALTVIDSIDDNGKNIDVISAFKELNSQEQIHVNELLQNILSRLFNEFNENNGSSTPITLASILSQYNEGALNYRIEELINTTKDKSGNTLFDILSDTYLKEVSVDNELNNSVEDEGEYEDEAGARDIIDSISVTNALTDTIKNLIAISPAGNLINDFNNTEEYIAKNSLNIVEELLKSIDFSINDQGVKNIISLLIDEEKRLHNIDDINNFVITERVTSQQLKDALRVVYQLRAVSASLTQFNYDDQPYGYASAVNNANAKYSTGDEMPMFNQRTFDLVSNELVHLESRINFLLNLSEFNSTNKKKIYKQDSHNMNMLYIRMFQAKSEERKMLEQMGFLTDKIDSVITENQELFDKLMTYLDDRDNQSIPSDDILVINTEVLKTNLEEILFEQFNQIENKNKVIEKLTTDLMAGGLIFEPGLYHKSTSQLNAYDKLVYFLTNMSSSSKKFYYDFLGSETDTSFENVEKSKFAPLGGQLIAARIDDAQTKNSSIFRTALIKLHELNKQYVASLSEDDRSNYENHNIQLFKNILFMDSAAGAGKSSVVISNSSALLLAAEKNNIILAPTNEQAKIAMNSVVSNDNVLNINDDDLTINSIFNQILGRELAGQVLAEISKSKSDITKDNALFKVDRSTNGDFDILVNTESDIYKKIDSCVNKDSFIKNGKDLHAILIDEGTHISKFELSLLDDIIDIYRKRTNKEVIIKLYGDTSQMGFAEASGQEYNIADSITLKAPRLLTSVRIGNNLRFRSTDNVIAQINEINKYISSKPNALENEIAQQVQLMGKQGVVSKLYSAVTEEGIRGDKVITSGPDVLSSVLDALKNTQGSIYVISDKGPDSEIFIGLQENPLYKERIKIFTPKEVQGNECDIAIIDIDPSAVGSVRNALAATYKSHLKKLYTVMSRSKKANIITSASLGKINYEVSENEIMSADSKMDDDMINYYKELFIKAGKGILTDYVVPEGEIKHKIKEPISTTAVGIKTLELLDQVITDEARPMVERQSEIMEHKQIDSRGYLMTHPWYERAGFSYFNGKTYFDNNSDVVAMYNLIKKDSDDDFATYTDDLVNSIIEEKGEIKDIEMMQALLTDRTLKLARKNAVNFKAAIIDYFSYQTESKLPDTKLPAKGLIEFMKLHNVDDKIIDKLDSNLEKSMKAKIVTKKFNSYDRSLGLSYIDRKDNEVMNFLAFEFDLGSEKIDMFVSVLPDSNKKNELEKIIYTDKDGNVSSVYNFMMSLSAKYDAAIKTDKKTNRVEQYINFDDKTSPFKTFGNTNFWRTKDKKQLSFIENMGSKGFDESRGRLLTMSEVNEFYGDNYIISDVYNYTGYTSKLPNAGNEASVVALFNKLADKKNTGADVLSGRPFILVSYDKTMKKDELINHFQRQLADYVQSEDEQQPRKVKDKVRLVPLDTDGVPFDAWLKMMYSAVVKSKSEEKGKGYKLMNAIGGNYMAARISASIFDIADSYNNFIKNKPSTEGYNKFKNVFNLTVENNEIDIIGETANNIMNAMDFIMSSHFDNKQGSFLNALKQSIQETTNRHKGDKTARKERILIGIQNVMDTFNSDKAGSFELENQELNIDYSMDVFLYSLKAAIFGGVHKVGSSTMNFAPSEITGFNFVGKSATEKLELMSSLSKALKYDYPHGIFFHPVYTHEGDRSDNQNAWAIKADKMDNLVHPITGEKIQMYLLNLDLQPPKLMIPLGDVELVSKDQLETIKEEKLIKDATDIQTQLNTFMTNATSAETSVDSLIALRDDCSALFDEIDEALDADTINDAFLLDVQKEFDSIKRFAIKAFNNVILEKDGEYIHVTMNEENEIEEQINVTQLLNDKFNKFQIESTQFDKDKLATLITITGKTESNSERTYQIKLSDNKIQSIDLLITDGKKINVTDSLDETFKDLDFEKEIVAEEEKEKIAEEGEIETTEPEIIDAAKLDKNGVYKSKIKFKGDIHAFINDLISEIPIEPNKANIVYAAKLADIKEIISKFVIDENKKEVIIYDAKSRLKLVTAVLNILTMENENYSNVGNTILNAINEFNKQHRC